MITDELHLQSEVDSKIIVASFTHRTGLQVLMKLEMGTRRSHICRVRFMQIAQYAVRKFEKNSSGCDL